MDSIRNSVYAMNNNKKLIVVPWDFTPVAEHALSHAVKISHMVKNDIALLHIIDPGSLSQRKFYFEAHSWTVAARIFRFASLRPV